MSGIDDYFARMMPDAMQWLEDQATAEPFAFGRPVAPGDPVSPFSQVSLDARKLSASIVVPDELLMDYGLIPDTRPKPPPPSWRTRLRRKLGDWRERAARRAFKAIAGYWPDNGEDDW